MTAEALSPPNPMQSLRERLIQEGSINPRNSESTKFESNQSLLKSTQDKVLAVLESCLNSQSFKAYKEFERINYLIQKALNTVSIKDVFNKSSCNYSGVLIFLNIYRLLKNIINKNNIFSKIVSVVRTGFFFAFKENMRNTP